jgi:ribonuclease III
MKKNDLTFIQDQIGYEFKNKDLLQQAFVRRSYSEENGGENNEVLEFVGDKVLDLIVVKLLTDKYGYFSSECDDYNPDEGFNEFISEHQEDKLTEIKKGLVKKETLANCIDNLGLADYLIVGKGDLKNNVQNEPSVKEDLFEAIIGAVALDANWNFEEMQSVVEIMLDIDSLLESGENTNYVQEIQEWVSRYSGSIPQFHFNKSSYESTFYLTFNGVSQEFNILGDSRINKVKYHCLLKIDDSMPIFRGFGESKKEARSAVCEVAYNYLEKNNKLFSIRDEIENPSWEQAINQLEILARRDYFSIPTYNFIEQHDKNGNPVWICECHIKEEKHCFSGISSSKKDAKKDAAYSVLKNVLGIEEE